MTEKLMTLREIATSASHALRSYQYGNGSPELAESVADSLDAVLARNSKDAISDVEINRAFAGYGLALRREEDPPIPGEPLMSMADAKRIARELVTAVAPHAGDPVTWERLRTAHSGMQGTEPWKADIPNEGHRIYRQSATEACYMCAALARIKELENALHTSSERADRMEGALSIIRARSETAEVDHPELGPKDFDSGFRAGLRDAAYYARQALSPSPIEGGGRMLGTPLVVDGEAITEGPGLGWKISPEARDKIEALIRENTRNASDLHSIVLATLPLDLSALDTQEGEDG